MVLAIVQMQIQKPKIQGNANWKRRIVQGGGGGAGEKPIGWKNWT